MDPVVPGLPEMVMTNIANWKMAIEIDIEIVSCPRMVIFNSYVELPQGKCFGHLLNFGG